MIKKMSNKMSGIEKEHSLTLAIREILYRFDTCRSDCFENPEIIQAFQAVKNLLWTNKEFWEQVGIAESWHFAFEEDTILERLQNLEEYIGYIKYRDGINRGKV